MKRAINDEVLKRIIEISREVSATAQYLHNQAAEATISAQETCATLKFIRKHLKQDRNDRQQR